MEIVKNIAAIIGCVLSLISLIALCSKAGRNLIRSFMKRQTKEIEDENKHQAQDIKEIKETVGKMTTLMNGFSQVLQQQCRNTIKDIYYKYSKEKQIPLYERKTVDITYKLYRDIWDGNSYATLIYEEIKKWEIVDTTPGADLDN